MNKKVIEEIIRRQLKARNLTSEKSICILEKEWGYVVEVTYSFQLIYNAILDKKGKTVFPLTCSSGDTGSIYRTEMKEYEDPSSGEKVWLPRNPSVSLKELDEHHFLIPSGQSQRGGNALFYIDENKQLTYKGYIEGKIEGSALSPRQALMDKKLLLSRAEVDATKDDYECFFYSWDKNCRVSDKWSTLDSLEYENSVKFVLVNQLNYPQDLVNKIINYMKLYHAWLATLQINSKDNKHHMKFVCLINENGIPIMDLIYLAPDYSVESIQLEKKEVGEVDEKREWLQALMDHKIMEFEERKKNVVSNFLNISALQQKNNDLLNTTTSNEEIDSTMNQLVYKKD